MSDTYFYCQSCNHKITVDQLALLNEGKCPSCSSLEGFSTVSKDESDGFETLTVINDTQLLEKVFDK
jgi:Zn finger protein HypA/HybF involved in hydrogenase expression